MNLKLIKEYKKQLALARISNNWKAWNSLWNFWRSLTPEQQFEIDVIRGWHKR